MTIVRLLFQFEIDLAPLFWHCGTLTSVFFFWVLDCRCTLFHFDYFVRQQRLQHELRQIELEYRQKVPLAPAHQDTKPKGISQSADVCTSTQKRDGD